MNCQACERGDHMNCGRQTWCQCGCDPEAETEYYPEVYEGQEGMEYQDS